jgi:hypothetical protein
MENDMSVRILVATGLALTLLLTGCGQSQDKKERIAAVTCAVMRESRDMDGAVRVREMNEARVKIGGEPFLDGDDVIKGAFEYGLCQELVLGIYDESLQSLKKAELKRELIAKEKRAEENKIADSKPSVAEEFYPNGVLKLRTNYKSKIDGRKKHGLFESWHDNGQVWGKVNYKDGKQHGLHEMYYENGEEYSWSPQCFQHGQEVDISNCKQL